MRVQELRRPGPVANRPLVLLERVLAEPGPGEVAVEVSACAVCRTDLQIVEGDLAARALPIVPGHQIVGTVVATGPGVTGGPGVPAVGARVGIAWIAGTCGHCRFCRSGRENLCETATFTGWDRDGGYAELVIARAAPAGDVVVQALEAVDRGGTVAINAIHLDRIPTFPYERLWWERTIRSVANVTRRDVAELLALAAAVPILTDIEVLPLAAANTALDRLARGDVSGAFVLRP